MYLLSSKEPAMDIAEFKTYEEARAYADRLGAKDRDTNTPIEYQIIRKEDSLENKITELKIKVKNLKSELDRRRDTLQGILGATDEFQKNIIKLLKDY